MIMPLAQKHFSLIQIAKTKLGLDDEDYRAILRSYGRVKSSRDLDRAGFDAVMKRFAELGFQSWAAERGLGHRSDRASPLQVTLIRDLWQEFTDGKGTDAALDKWIEGRFLISSLRFLGPMDARKAIGALRIMNARRGGGLGRQSTEAH